MEMLNSKMSFEDVIYTMSDGNPGAINVLFNLLNAKNGLIKILELDSLDIRGSKLYMLYNDCCKRDMDKFNRTLMMLNMGIFGKNVIQANLSQTYAIPFIDDSIEMDESLKDSSNIGLSNSKWVEYCNKNKLLFLKNLKKSLEYNNEKDDNEHVL